MYFVRIRQLSEYMIYQFIFQSYAISFKEFQKWSQISLRIEVKKVNQI